MHNLLSAWNQAKTNGWTFNAKEFISDNLFTNKYKRWRIGSPHLLSPKRELFKAISENVKRFKDEGDCHGLVEWFNQHPHMRDVVSVLDIVESIFGHHDYIICNDCNYIEHIDDSAYCYSDYYVCSDCCNSGYRWSEYRDTYVSEDDYYDELSDDDDGCCDNIGEYHSSKDELSHIPSSYDNRKTKVYMGLELEMEIHRDYSRDDKAGELLSSIGTYRDDEGDGYNYAFCESDGSLDYGFEMVTGWTGLDVHEKQLEFFKNGFAGAKSHDTKTCGLHIHICKADMSTLHGAKMIFFINDTNNHKLIKAIARRDASSYAKIKNKKEDTSWLKDSKNFDDRLRNLNQDRYEALNFRNAKTIEFRLFKGTLKYESIMACLEFTYATWFFTRDASVSELTTEKFLEFICKSENLADTKYLRAYLKGKGFRLPKLNSSEKTEQSQELELV